MIGWLVLGFFFVSTLAMTVLFLRKENTYRDLTFADLFVGVLTVVFFPLGFLFMIMYSPVGDWVVIKRKEKRKNDGVDRSCSG